ncbi:aspartate 4-decarboxylase [Pullulanibacillus sp. KACC 23026]|uniref:aspartate 4-decarboxylase n=1 Tax=Pullulanibacillus sp. KACC 23026 TaxID=3028315 RepID=UPI0023B204C3|nr:aspartate 4-decarboxylase [Pullulanibacillus sp. KACC 23026]WEG14815.1 aspartate 4-decarboxylase [Pullulanibacillus sp. KACC 23026]
MAETKNKQGADDEMEHISPFEIKNKLVDLAEGKKRMTRTMLDAGRGNPNWIAATPREAFFVLGQFAVSESRRVWNEYDLAGMPSREGIQERFEAYVKEHSEVPGIQLLKDIVDYGINELDFDPEKWLYELVDGIIGDNYPNPDRMLVRTEKAVQSFLLQELYGNDTSVGSFDLFAVEGATAAMCYIFDTLFRNYLIPNGSKIAVMVPIFPPYIEIPELPNFDFDVVDIRASALDKEGHHTWQYPDEELEKLTDPTIKAVFIVNPSNPPSVALTKESRQKIIDIVKNNNPDLMIISDDVYGTFIEGFRSLMVDLPYNTIGVYSFSKYYGVTGWRLGTIAVNQSNVFNKLLEELPSEQKEILHKRYSSLTPHPEKLTFMDRLVADSRTVAMNHTAGLSTPQQVQMALFSIFSLLDKENRYKKQTMEICHRRMNLLYEGLGLPKKHLPNDADYYTEFDLEIWSNHHFGHELTDYMQAHYKPIDILYRLAERSSIVLLNGEGFLAPSWSIRVSLANLEDEAYLKIGQELHHILQEIAEEWEEQKETKHNK